LLANENGHAQAQVRQLTHLALLVEEPDGILLSQVDRGNADQGHANPPGASVHHLDMKERDPLHRDTGLLGGFVDDSPGVAADGLHRPVHDPELSAGISGERPARFLFMSPAQFCNMLSLQRSRFKQVASVPEGTVPAPVRRSVRGRCRGRVGRRLIDLFLHDKSPQYVGTKGPLSF
jgi:hypothetical protein